MSPDTVPVLAPDLGAIMYPLGLQLAPHTFVEDLIINHKVIMLIVMWLIDRQPEWTWHKWTGTLA